MVYERDCGSALRSGRDLSQFILSRPVRFTVASAPPQSAAVTAVRHLNAIWIGVQPSSASCATEASRREFNSSRTLLTDRRRSPRRSSTDKWVVGGYSETRRPPSWFRNLDDLVTPMNARPQFLRPARTPGAGAPGAMRGPPILRGSTTPLPR